MQALGVYGCTVITAITAQNTQRVFSVEPPSEKMIRQQIQALKIDLPPKALKIGMLPTPEIAQIVAQEIETLSAFKLYDPVMVSTSGDSLMAEETISVLKKTLLPQLDLMTPNLPEVEQLLGKAIPVEMAAQELLQMGVKSVLIKGGHTQGDYCQDYWTDGHEAFWLTSPRIETRHTHGTGCTLSAAITACIALGYPLADALVIAKAYVNQGLRLTPGLGEGHGPLAHLGWPEKQEDLPWLTPNCRGGFKTRPRNDDLGFYPIVNRAAWLEKLLPLGVSTIQLRIKDLQGEALEAEIRHAVLLAEQYGCRLFINDYWELALKYHAYGVHLGQEDLEWADLQALAQAGIHLGISTHCYAEVARALAIQPSYIAIGPVFETTTKPMAFQPQGLEQLAYWCRTLKYPLVAIGGIFLENAPDVLKTGVGSLAVVRDITQAEDLDRRVLAWRTLFEPGLDSARHAENVGVTPGP